MKKFSKFQIASFKRTAQNVYPLVRRKEKLLSEINDCQNELESIQTQIDAYQGPIKAATGGYSTEDIIVREVVTNGTDKNGNPAKQTIYKLKYPETIIPIMEEDTTTEQAVAGAVEDTTGSDFDMDKDQAEAEVDITPENITPVPANEEVTKEEIDNFLNSLN